MHITILCIEFKEFQESSPQQPGEIAMFDKEILGKGKDITKLQFIKIQ